MWLQLRTNRLISSALSIDDALNRLSALFMSECVTYSRSSDSIVSIKTPVALFSLDRRLYSKKNWVGVNPFIFVSGVEITCRYSSVNRTDVSVSIDRKRAAVMYVVAMAFVLVVGSVVPAKAVFVGVFATILFLSLNALSGALVIKEIKAELNN